MKEEDIARKPDRIRADIDCRIVWVIYHALNYLLGRQVWDGWDCWGNEV